MKTRLFSLLLAAALLLGMIPMALADSGLQNFEKSVEYAGFSDVKDGDWFAPNVAAACQYGMMNGTGGGQFSPVGTVSVAQAVTMAARLHRLYREGVGTFDTAGTETWYDAYVDYAVDQGLMVAGQFPKLDADATRAQFAGLLAAAFPEEALEPINSIDAIPDVPADSAGARAIYRLYNAGILTGSDIYGSFKPASTITRSEAAAILTRMADPDLRREFTPDPATAVTVYAPDGRTREVPVSEYAQYPKDGWYTEPVCYVYAAGGAKKVIAESGKGSYPRDGWYTYPVCYVYKADGSRSTIAESDKGSYPKDGWYTYPVCYVYKADGSRSTIAESDKGSYPKDGWYPYPVSSVYALDGRTRAVPTAELGQYPRDGWYPEPMQYVYSDTGVAKLVPQAQVSAYVAEGWYRTTQEAQITVYALDGRSKTIYRGNLAREQAGGWYTEADYEAYLAAQAAVGQTYVLNTNSMKFHYPGCASAGKIKAVNRQVFTGSRETLIARGYSPCGQCKP